MGARTVIEIRNLFSVAEPDVLRDLILEYSTDEREGVRSIVASARRRLSAFTRESERLDALMALQIQLEGEGTGIIAGVDEVGRGALAGPVSAAAVILPAHVRIAGLDDSKRLTRDNRESVARRVHTQATAVAIAHVWPDQIDALGIAAANTLAMQSALDGLSVHIDHVIADGLRVHLTLPATFVVGGDRECGCVAAASVVAKVERDRLMRELDDSHPGYGFAINKGYGTAEHIAAIRERGPSPVHRLSFSPCSQESLF